MNYYEKSPFFEENEPEQKEPTYNILTPKEVMDELAIGRSTFYKLVNSGQLPSFRIGKLIRVRREELKQIGCGPSH